MNRKALSAVILMIAVASAICMMLSTVSIANIENGEPTYTSANNDWVQISSWDGLKNGLIYGGDYQLTDDVSAVEGFEELKVCKSSNLDLNGHTIDALGKFRVIRVNSGVTLNITNSGQPDKGIITGGKITGGVGQSETDGCYGGAGIYVDVGGTLNITNCTITGNKIDASHHTVEVEKEGKIIEEEHAYKVHGGGICCIGNMTITGCSIENNELYVEDSPAKTVELMHGGGIYCKSASDITIKNTTIANNLVHIIKKDSETRTLDTVIQDDNDKCAGIQGGGICIDGAAVEIIGCTISKNKVHDDCLTEKINLNGKCEGGGISVINDGKCTITGGVSISSNTGVGGGIAVSYDSDVTIESPGENKTNKISENTSALRGGGGIYLFLSSKVDITDTEIIKNTAQYFGGGVLCTYKSVFEMHNGAITENKVTQFSDDAGGGGLYVKDGGNLKLYGVTISKNSATNGGGIYSFFENWSVDTGNKVEIYGCDIISNTSYNGGGIASLITRANDPAYNPVCTIEIKSWNTGNEIKIASSTNRVETM